MSDPGAERNGHRACHQRLALPRALGGARRWMLVQLAAIGIAQSVCVVAFAFLLHVLLDRVEHRRGHFHQSGMYRLIEGWSTPALMIGLVVVSAATVVLKATGPPVAERLAQSYVHSVRVRLFDHVTGSQSWAANRRAIGVTVLRFTGDSSALRSWAGQGVAALVVNGVFVGCTIGILAIALPIAGAATISALVICSGAAALLGHRLQSSVRATRRSNGRLASFVNERVTYAAVIQSLGRIGLERRALSRHSRRFSRAMVHQARLVGAIGAAAEAARIGVVVAVIGTVVLVHAPADTLTSLVTIAGFLSGPLSSLAQAQEAWQRSQIARRRITEVIGTPARLTAPRSAPPLADGPGRLELAEVTLTGVLDTVSATVAPGQRVAVRGPAGAGKSLLLALIARLHVADDGAVLLDGQDLAQHDPVSVGRAVRLVSADLPLLRGSVEANLRHGEIPENELDDAPRERLRALAPVLACLEAELAELLPEGLRTRVGEGGYGLSRAGCFQVALARALRSGPRVLLLDWAEAENAVSHQVFDTLFTHYPGTLIYVTPASTPLGRADTHWLIGNKTLTVRPSIVNRGHTCEQPSTGPAGLR